MASRRFETYVSHVDIFLVFCYGNEMLCETIVRSGSNRRNHFSWLNTALIDSSPYRDLSLEAKAAANHQTRQVPTALHMHRDLYKHGEAIWRCRSTKCLG